MTIHVNFTYQCTGCQAFFVPYQAALPCPRCGRPADDAIDFLSVAIDSMLLNKQHGGVYTPGAWFSGSYGDHVLLLLFHLFDAFDESGGDSPFPLFAACHLANVDWGSQEYAAEHVCELAWALHERLRQETKPRQRKKAAKRTEKPG